MTIRSNTLTPEQQAGVNVRCDAFHAQCAARLDAKLKELGITEEVADENFGTELYRELWELWAALLGEYRRRVQEIYEEAGAR